VNPFEIGSRAELAKLLRVLPVDIDEVIANRQRYYRNSTRPKSDGGLRVLRVPEGRLKLLQQKVKVLVLDSIPPHSCVHGGVKGRSAVTNALPHVGKRVVFVLDVKDFFPSVSRRAVGAIFGSVGFNSEAAEALVDITTWDNQLPQGAATSVDIANLAMKRVDVRLETLARLHGFAYTRYVDDLTLSGHWRLLGFRRLIQRIIEQAGFRINPMKVRTMDAGMRQVVTGIVVNDKLNLPREKRDSIRREVFALHSVSARREIELGKVRGKLSWFASVNPDQALRLRNRAGLQ
jgi:retron-type reverse transcriptase